jgi:oxygen-independent coproporphyrinogen-3 oxidase
VTVSSIYIGGGTPTYLSEKQLCRVLKILNTSFKIKKDAEITIEVGPETIAQEKGEEKLKILLENGVNRLSIGFQTADNKILKLLRRRHNSKKAIDVFNLAREIGFQNINIDLIPGLPDQTLIVWQNDLRQIGSMKPSSITCYPLSIKESMNIWPIFKKERQRFPNREEVILMQIMACEFFNQLGYNQLPACWFVKHPERREPEYKFEKSGNQLSLGVSTYSFINGFQYFNFPAVEQYIEAVGKGDLPIWKGIKLSKEESMRRSIIFDLKTGLNTELFETKFGEKPKAVFESTWKRLENLGLTEDDGKIIGLSYKGKLFADEVCKEFFSVKVKIPLRNKIKG